MLLKRTLERPVDWPEIAGRARRRISWAVGRRPEWRAAFLRRIGFDERQESRPGPRPAQSPTVRTERKLWKLRPALNSSL